MHLFVRSLVAMLATIAIASSGVAQGLSPSGELKAFRYRGIGPDMTRSEMEAVVHLGKLFERKDACANIGEFHVCEYLAYLLPDRMLVDMLVMSDTVARRAASVTLTIPADGYSSDLVRQIFADEWGEPVAKTQATSTDSWKNPRDEYVGRWARAEYEAEAMLRDGAPGRKVLILILQNIARLEALADS